MSLYIPKMSDTPAITIPGLAGNFGTLSSLTPIENGEFTPYLQDSGGDLGNYDSQVGEYVRLGNLVFVRIFLTSSFDYSATPGTGQLSLGGLPFTSASSTPLALGRVEGFSLPEGVVSLLAHVDGRSVYFRFHRPDVAITFPYRSNISADGFRLSMAGVYRI
jgi:hypothetical protein